MPPTRRSLIRSTALLSLGLAAGCLGDGGPGGTANSTEPTTDTDATETQEPTEMDDTNETDGDGTGTETDDADGTQPANSPLLAVVDADDAPDVPVEHAVEVTEATTTDEHPPQIRVTVTNTSDSAVQLGDERDVFFRYVADDSDELTFLPPEDDYPADPGCWRLEDPLMVTSDYRTFSLDAGESRSKRVDLYGAAPKKGDSKTCLPLGEYRFETNFSTGVGENQTEQQATWGFSVSLEAQDD
ncbi:hypothetical protein C440_02263 [Haloferax mucosum ATCC BAA-1512]|uniref:Lipoprotein n=1 Tax=Haloferax mucosum ATCC BAA-1512 TaxID=662479 RepID=M0IRG1_9EURY|nr:hypothetical protein [Haloferax mucosum]ELZ98034.1 hypothetical protein C440_02263 [Haloferax mucosum ATCC BAA-1512]